MIHTELGIVMVLLSESRIDNVVDSRDGDTRLGDVGSDNDLPRSFRRRLEHLRLNARDLSSVNRVDTELRDLRTESLHSLEEDLARRVDFLLTCEEKEDVAWRFREMNLHHRDESGVEVVGFGFLGVEDLDGEGVSRDGEDGATEEVL